MLARQLYWQYNTYRNIYPKFVSEQIFTINFPYTTSRNLLTVLKSSLFSVEKPLLSQRRVFLPFTCSTEFCVCVLML